MGKSFKILIGLFVYGLTFLVLATAGAFWWLAKEYRAPGPLQAETLFEVDRGESLFTIADNLHEAGAIKQPLVFIFGTRIMGAQSDLKAGEYQIMPQASPREIMELIRKGDVVDRRVTVREGLTSYEVVEILKKVDQLEGSVSALPPEGSLLPQTYDYRLHETRDEIIARMKEGMDKTIAELWEKRVEGLPFNTVQEAITLASIVEKETGIEAERKRVAGVFINRLKRGIPLQTDPTVIYGITKGEHKNDGLGPLGRRLLKKDLETDSPYNTYLHAGLPPGPIANPGRASIEAVLQPETHDYIYFVADGTGGHVFAATLDEHNRNVEQWRKIRREQNKKD